jgi:hypothetical protein
MSLVLERACKLLVIEPANGNIQLDRGPAQVGETKSFLKCYM